MAMYQITINKNNKPFCRVELHTGNSDNAVGIMEDVFLPRFPVDQGYRMRLEKVKEGTYPNRWDRETGPKATVRSAD